MKVNYIIFHLIINMVQTTERYLLIHLYFSIM